MGRPTGVRVFSVQDTVTLSWDRIALSDLTGFQIYRKAEFESGFSPIEFNPPGLSSYEDTDVAFDVEYTYQVSAVGRGYESGRSDSVAIVPGPTFNWVANNFNRQLVKLTHDSRHRILSAGQFFTIIDIEPNPVSGEVWLIERFSVIDSRVIRVSPKGKVLEPILRLTSPIDASLDVRSGALWIADSRDGVVVKLDSVGNRQFTLTRFSNPISLSADPRDGSCWVADGASNQVARIGSDATQIDFSSARLDHVQSLAANSIDGSVWISDSTRVLKLNQSGTVELELAESFDFASTLAVNDVTGEVWIIELVTSTVSKFSSNGEKIFEIGGFSSPQDLSVNLFDNSCLVADSRNHRLVRLSAGGSILNTYGDIRFPDVVRVQNQPIHNSSGSLHSGTVR